MVAPLEWGVCYVWLSPISCQYNLTYVSGSLSFIIQHQLNLTGICPLPGMGGGFWSLHLLVPLVLRESPSWLAEHSAEGGGERKERGDDDFMENTECELHMERKPLPQEEYL